MALAPLTMAGFAWLLVAERMTGRARGGAVAGILGVLLLLGGASGSIDPMGVAASRGGPAPLVGRRRAGQALERRHPLSR